MRGIEDIEDVPLRGIERRFTRGLRQFTWRENCLWKFIEFGNSPPVLDCVIAMLMQHEEPA